MVPHNLQPQIAIITDEPGWHGSELTNALQNHGFGTHYVSLTECQFAFEDSGPMIRLPGFENRLPLGVFVRGVPGGSLDQVIFRLDILHALVSTGVTVYNEPRAIERTVDKAMTTLLLKQAGLPTPPTWVFESYEQAQYICQQELKEGRSVVLKPLFGSQGQGVYLINKEQGLVHDEKFAGLYYLQRFVKRAESNWSDIRVFVIDGKAIAAMRRRSTSWITNRARGAECEHLALDTELSRLAVAAAKAVDIDYGGIDLMVDEQGRLQIIEVNGIPAWWGLQSVTDFNVAGLLIDHFVRRIGDNHVLTVLS